MLKFRLISYFYTIGSPMYLGLNIVRTRLNVLLCLLQI